MEGTMSTSLGGQGLESSSNWHLCRPCGSLLDLAPHVVEGIGCESDQQPEDQGRQRRNHAHAQFHAILRVIAQMIFWQDVVEEQPDQSGRNDARERDGGYAQWCHAVPFPSRP